MRVGVLGLGSIGSRHARNLRDMGHDVSVYDPINIESAARRMSWDDAVDGADAVVIASPSDRHLAALDQVIICGKPVFVEKPIATRLPDAVQHVLENAERKRVPVFVGYNLRFHKCVIKAKKWLGEGLIGAPLWASFTCSQFNDKPTYQRDGVILNWSHEIDLALHLLGPAKVACAAAHTTDGCDDIADIVLQHANDVQSHIHLDYRTRPELRGSVIVGTKALIIVDLALRHAWLRDTTGNVLEHFEAHDSFDSNYIDEMRAFIDRIEGKDVPGATGEDGLAALDICLQARRMAGLQ